MLAVIEECNMNQNLSPPHLEQRRIAFIQAGWHADIVGNGREAFLAQMETLHFPRDRIDVYTVPGAYEIPLHAKKLARSGRYRGVVACGFVVDGGIYRHDFVANAVIHGLMQVQLDTEVPVFSMVLTPHHFHEHETHQGFYLDHFEKKGIEVARACIDTMAAIQKLPTVAAGS